MRETRKLLGDVLAERQGRPADDFEIEAFTAAVGAVGEMTITKWVDGDGKDDLLAMLDQGLEFLAGGSTL